MIERCTPQDPQREARMHGPMVLSDVTYISSDGGKQTLELAYHCTNCGLPICCTMVAEPDVT
jgi:hypothetical protein